MFKNPLFNALCASGYIVLIVTLMNFIMKTQGEKPDTATAPVVFLSLLTLSVTVMAYLFFYQPLQLFISGKKKDAVNLFTRTVYFFAAFTAVALLLLFSGII